MPPPSRRRGGPWTPTPPVCRGSYPRRASRRPRSPPLPGTCLFEGTNVSKGCGTTQPFENVGGAVRRHARPVLPDSPFPDSSS
ncbi:hypothetical protein ACWERY_29970 [Streptomyces sp. NPDC004082]|uniref:hypothetical protein n=1 Tax=unclassified Streptomyces TaxID=2593676 RepID=UPI0033AC86EE